MENKLRSFFESNYSLFENQDTENEDDNLSTKLVNSILIHIMDIKMCQWEMILYLVNLVYVVI